MGDRITIALACTECETRNYKTTRKAGSPGPDQPSDNASKEAKPGQLSLKKFCPTCKRHTLHKETK